MNFKALQKFIRSGRGTAALLPSRRINYFLTKLMTGNKSGAPLLTTFILKPGAATNGLLKGPPRAPSRLTIRRPDWRSLLKAGRFSRTRHAWVAWRRPGTQAPILPPRVEKGHSYQNWPGPLSGVNGIRCRTRDLDRVGPGSD